MIFCRSKVGFILMGSLFLVTLAFGNVGHALAASPILSFSPETGYDGVDGVNPNGGPPSTPLAFKIVYTHPDNLPPFAPNNDDSPFPPLAAGDFQIAAFSAPPPSLPNGIMLIIDRSSPSDPPFVHIEKTLSRDTVVNPNFPHLHDGDYTNGEQFGKSEDQLALSIPGTYEYHFLVTDGTNTVRLPASGEFTFVLGEAPSNQPPTLTFPSSEEYSDNGLHPDKGTAGLTPFNFKTIYTDPENEPPHDLAVYVDNGISGAVPYWMSPDTSNGVAAHLKDGNYANGEQYIHKGSFPKGDYSYYFETSDGETIVRLPVLDEFNFVSDFSNVAFLPGYGGSRLYKKDMCHIGLPNPIECENQLWEPNAPYTHDLTQLAMKQDGSPLISGIYTQDIINETPQNIEAPWGNVYKKFKAFMDEEMEGKIINKWRAFPYDWRLSLETVADSDVQLQNNEVYRIVQEIRDLADNSKTGKVTLVGHSNGGLLAKVIIDRLTQSGEEEIIDRVVMVGTPQIGTPKSIIELLHGTKPWIVNYANTLSRELVENMVSVYNFIPSKKYFDLVGSPVIEFDPEVVNIYDFLSLYDNGQGNTDIDTAEELHRFLLGDNGNRTEPEPDDTDAPNVLKADLLTQATATHNNLVDVWEPPKDEAGNSLIEVIQIAGWGLDTIRGIRYDDCDTCGFLGLSQTLSNLDRDPLEVEDGDGTVVTASATAMNYITSTSNYPTFYVNLPDHNDEGRLITLNARRNRKHADIMEVEELQDFLKQVIGDNLNLDVLPQFIGTEKPEPDDDDNKLRLRVKSPISIDVYDSFGNHTGLIPNPDPNSDIPLIEAQIPNSYYYEIGEKKYLGLDTKDEYRIEIKGLDLGTFTLEIDEVLADEVVDTTSFTDIPVTPNTTGSFAIQTVDSASGLELDIEGDGNTDITIKSSEGVDSLTSLKVLRKTIQKLDIHKGLKKGLVNQVKAAEKIFKKKLPKVAQFVLKDTFPKVADNILKGMIIQLKNFPSWLINSSDSEALIQIIEKIRSSLV